MSENRRALVQLSGLEKTFTLHNFLYRDEETGKRPFYSKRRVEAVRDVNFEIYEGEIFGLLGPNGAGKTTTVKMLSGLVKPDKGTVKIDGLEVERYRKRVLEKVGVVLEGTRTSMWPLTPMENLAYYGNLKNVSGKVLNARSHYLLDFIGLKEKKNVEVRHLSRGQKQKLAICIALIADPQVLLLDEPTTGLDVQSARAIKDKIIEMTREHGKSVLVTTHDMHVAQELCDRIGIIDKGKLVACKGTDELLGHFSDQVYAFKLDRVADAANFASMPGVLTAENEQSVEGPLLVLSLVPESTVRSETLYNVLEALRAQKYELRGIAQRQQNLESIFLQLTTSSI
jgi:ABC-2 type transport system ATP-binding protein